MTEYVVRYDVIIQPRKLGGQQPADTTRRPVNAVIPNIRALLLGVG